ncbi:MDR family MFS transporter [Actinocrispum sp. NPDC049592]|uniref:MDR family MFS transporter n=1 Tax=Actinocrispum sp. NPDC049592 TaxID=3154835 RepID=UPI00343C7BA6
MTQAETRSTGRGAQNAVVAAIMLGMLLSALDQTIVSTALPTIVSDLGGGNHLSWVVTSYLLAETIMTILVGKFGDLYGRKKMFLLSVGLFVVGSFFAGWADSMGWLIASRAVQGLGAGGLLVTATAVIADVVPLSERGKYQGFVGSVFGVATVVGPLLGGLFVDHLSWRWAFYVNIPIGLLVLAVAAFALPSVAAPNKPKIDYLGILLIALASTGLTLVTSWGGTEYPWGSPTIIWMAVGSVVALVAFVFVEMRAAEPMLPLRLFRSRVFTVSSVLSFIVGFALLGGVTYLPTYLQFVHGATATGSGLRMLPLVAGLMVAAIVVGQVISKTGRYRWFPVIGSLLIAGGLLLLSLMDASTTFWVTSGYMIVLGLGVGMVMPVPTVVVQSTSDYKDLGVATSGVSFLRTLGSSFGVAIFGTIYAGQLPDHLGPATPPGIDPRIVMSPKGVAALPDPARLPVINAYADTLQTMFLVAAPVGILAFLVALLLREVPLRDSARVIASGNSGVGESFAVPASSDSEVELEKLISLVVSKQKTDPRPEILARSGVPLSFAQAWLLVRVFKHSRDDGDATLLEIAENSRIPPGIFEPVARQLVDSGYATEAEGHYRFTPQGTEAFTRLIGASRVWMLERLADWDELENGFSEAVDRMSERMIASSRELTAGRHAAAGV